MVKKFERGFLRHKGLEKTFVSSGIILTMCEAVSYFYASRILNLGIHVMKTWLSQCCVDCSISIRNLKSWITFHWSWVNCLSRSCRGIEYCNYVELHFFLKIKFWNVALLLGLKFQYNHKDEEADFCNFYLAFCLGSASRQHSRSAVPWYFASFSIILKYENADTGEILNRI